MDPRVVHLPTAITTILLHSLFRCFKCEQNGVKATGRSAAQVRTRHQSPDGPHASPHRSTDAAHRHDRQAAELALQHQPMASLIEASGEMQTGSGVMTSAARMGNLLVRLNVSMLRRPPYGGLRSRSVALMS